jgi:valyl-tRNA synthetase
MELAKSFEPADIERRWYPHWEQAGYFAPHIGHHSAGFLHPTAAPQCYGDAAHGARL